MACLQCPTMYAQMDGKTGEAVQISKPIPLPALNVRPNLKMATQYLITYCIRIKRSEHVCCCEMHVNSKNGQVSRAYHLHES